MALFNRWSRADVIGLGALIVAIVACITAIFVPEVRSWFLGGNTDGGVADSSNVTDSVISPAPGDSSIVITPSKTTLFPLKLIHGDGDLVTGANKLSDYTVRGELDFDSTRVRCRVYMKIRERRPDNTTGEGESIWKTVFTSRGAWKITNVNPVGTSERKGTINSQEITTLSMQASEVVRQFTMWGDNAGDDIPRYCKLEVLWQPVTISLKRRD